MDYNTSKYDNPISFTHSLYKPVQDRTVLTPHESQEQEFQTVRPGPFQDTFGSASRSRSADRPYETGTYGYDPNYRAYENSNENNLHIPLEKTANFNYNPNTIGRQTPRKIQEPISEQQEFRNLIRTEARNLDKREPGLRVETQKRAFVVQGSGSKFGSGSKIDMKGSKTPRKEDKGTPKMRKVDFEARGPREQEKKAYQSGNRDTGHSFERIGEGNVSKEEEENEERRLDVLIRENKVKDRRIESLERQLEDLLANVDVYKTRLTGHIEVIRKELTDNDLHVLRLRENLDMLSVHNSRIVDLAQRNASFELGQEIEKNRTVWGKMNSEIEKVAKHVKTSEEQINRLWGIVIQQSQELTADASTLSGQVLDYEIKGKWGFEVEKLKEDVRLFADAMDSKEKTVRRLTGQVRDLEDLIGNYLKTESGQLNSGLKNTARKLIELQNRLDSSNLGKERLENQVGLLRKKNEGLQREVEQLEKEREEGKGMEKVLREMKTELKKAQSRNEVLEEINGKNETIIATLKAMVEDLKGNRLGIWDKGVSLYTTETAKYEPLGYVGMDKGYEASSYKTEMNPVYHTASQNVVIPSLESWNYKDHGIGTKLDGGTERREAVVGHGYDTHTRELLGQGNSNYKDPLVGEHNFRNNVINNEPKIQYEDYSKFETSPLLNSDMRTVESWPVSAQLTPIGNLVGMSDNLKANRLDSLQLELNGIQGMLGANPEKDSQF